MSNFVVPGPDGRIPSIQYIENLRDAGILTPQIAEKQINYIKIYNQSIQSNLQKRSEIIKKLIESNSKLNNSKNQINGQQIN